MNAINSIAKCNPLPANFPPELCALGRWVVWAYSPNTAPGKKPRKWPYNPRTGKGPIDPHDPSNWGSIDDVVGAYTLGDYAGVGFDLNGDGLIGIDLDNCVTDGTPDPQAMALMDRLGAAYVEFSPSGRGLRGFGYGPQIAGGKRDLDGVSVELYSNGQYLTLTGHTLRTGPLAQLNGLGELIKGDTMEGLLTGEQVTHLREATMYLAGRGFGAEYCDWEATGQALKSSAHMGRDAEMLALWIDYSRACGGYTDDADVLKKWRQLKGDRTGPGAIFKRAQESGWVNPARADAALSDVKIAAHLAGAMAGKFLYEHGGREWLIYSDGAWVTCRKGEAQEAAKAASLALLQTAQAQPTREDYSRMFSLATRAMSAPGIAAALKLAQSDVRLSSHPAEFDTDLDTLNCLNGVVDLRSGELHAHDPAHRLSKRCTVDAAPAPAPRWMQFMHEISCNDLEWVDYMQRACGYILTGRVREEVLFFWLGTGANGKSVFANVLRRILGGYCATLDPGILMVRNRDGESATPSLANLPGVRLALMNEVEAGSRMSGQGVKTLASTEAMSARHLYGAAFAFVPTHKVVVRGNHKPIIPDDDDGLWRRIHLVQFAAKFPIESRDAGLEDKLMGEASGILHWMIQGAVKYYGQGLGACDAVTRETLAYRTDSDLMGQWLAEYCTLGGTLSCNQGQAFGAWCFWCEDNGLHSGTKPSFTARLKGRGFGTRREGSGSRSREYVGFALSHSLPGLFS